MISKDKKCNTRSGKEVVIYTINGTDSKFPVIGQVAGDPDTFEWSKDGMYRHDKTESPYDLIEVIEPKQYTAENINTYNFEQLSGVAKMCMDRMLELSKG
jgi:hypothetical protein